MSYMYHYSVLCDGFFKSVEGKLHMQARNFRSHLTLCQQPIECQLWTSTEYDKI